MNKENSAYRTNFAFSAFFRLHCNFCAIVCYWSIFCALGRKQSHRPTPLSFFCDRKRQFTFPKRIYLRSTGILQFITQENYAQYESNQIVNVKNTQNTDFLIISFFLKKMLNNILVSHRLVSHFEKECIKLRKVFVLFLDYDGTLTPIVARPDLAILHPSTFEILQKLSTVCKKLAIVSGRAKHDVKELVKIPQLYYAGSHGFDIEEPSVPVSSHTVQQKKFQMGTEYIPVLEQVFERLQKELGMINGCILENNKFSLSVHYRLVSEETYVKYIFEKTDSIVKEVNAQFSDAKIKLTQGKMVIEVRINLDWHKGKAVEYLLKEWELNEPSKVFAMYVGDDKTDEDAFRYLRDSQCGMGVLVAKEDDPRVVNPEQTSASYRLNDTTETQLLLQQVYECLVQKQD